MIAPVGTPVRHRTSKRRGIVRYSPGGDNATTLVRFTGGPDQEYLDTDLEAFPSLDTDVPALSWDGEHAHITAGPEYVASLQAYLQQGGVIFGIDNQAMNNADVIDFGAVVDQEFDRIQAVFQGWLDENMHD